MPPDVIPSRVHPGMERKNVASAFLMTGGAIYRGESPPYITHSQFWGKEHGTIREMATIMEFSALEEGHNTDVTQCRNRGTDPSVQLYRSSGRQVDAPPSTYTAG